MYILSWKPLLKYHSRWGSLSISVSSHYRYSECRYLPTYYVCGGVACRSSNNAACSVRCTHRAYYYYIIGFWSPARRVRRVNYNVSRIIIIIICLWIWVHNIIIAVAVCAVYRLLCYKCAYSHVNERRTDGPERATWILFIVFYYNQCARTHYTYILYAIIFLSRWFYTAVADGKRNENTI